MTTPSIDGSLADWSADERIDRQWSVPGFDIYGRSAGDAFFFALVATSPIGPNTTVWIDADQDASTGYQIFGFAGGAEYNIDFDATGTPHLYTGGAGEILVPDATVTFAYSPDRTVLEFSVQAAALGDPRAINTLWDVNDSTFLPTNYSAPPYEVLNTNGLPERSDFSQRVGIVYSETSAALYFSDMAYSQLFMAAQNQAAMAGVQYDILTESDLTDIAKLVNYDALVFPSFAGVRADQVADIEHTLKLAVQHYDISLIAAGELMTRDESGAALGADPYARMKSLLDLNIVGGGWPVDVTVRAGDVTNAMMDDYAAGELIRSYSGVGWLGFAAVSGTANVLATQTVGGTTYNAVVETVTGGRNVHFSTEAVMGDNNLLWQAIDHVVNDGGVTAGLQLSRQASIVASRTDMDQAMEVFEVSPDDGAPGIYDVMLPILDQWKADYGFVGSYYVDIGADTREGQYTDWSVSGAYYERMLALGNEIGSHSTTHPHDTNALTPAQIEYEFEGSKLIIEQQMSALLGQPFTVDGAAVPGAPENLATALSILQYYDYLSGGYSSLGAGYPGAFGYLTPEMAAADKVYLAPNLKFDFSLVEFQGMTPEQATAEWQREWADVAAHSDVPIVLWPWHDYGAADWPTSPPADSPYTTAMFTDFIARAHSAGAEFLTLADLAGRISAFDDSSVTTSVSGNVLTATVASANSGRFALDLDHLGSQRIAGVAGWYAYDEDSVFLDRDGGTFAVTLGAAADDVTHITRLPMRAELVSLSGNGTDLAFSVIGEGRVVIDLTAPAGRQAVVTGASIVSQAGDILTLDLGAVGRHDVSVSLVANRPPAITSNATVAILENGTGVTTVTATDPDGTTAFTYAIVGGADQSLFRISPTGVLSFAAAPNFEAPADEGRDNGYVVQVRVSDSGSPALSDIQTLTISVTDVNDNAPVITTAATQSVAENTTRVAMLAATDADTVGTAPAVFTITGGADASKFAIAAGDLVFVAAPDFELPADADRNNSYLVQVTASDGLNASSRLISVNVADVFENRAPVISSNGGGAAAALSLPENTLAVTTVRATDPDAGQVVSYAIAGGADAARFGINATTGVLSFLAGPDFEVPGDAGGNNVYDVIVAARDNLGASDTQALAVSILNVKGSTLTGNNSANVLNGTVEEDVLSGQGGNDTLNGGGGNDVLNGGNGLDRLTGGAGSDRFVINNEKQGRDTITDFTRGGGADVLDIRDVLSGYRAGSDIDDFVRLSGGADTTVMVNVNGRGNDFTAIATLQGVAMSPTLLDDLLAQGNLVVT